MAADPAATGAALRRHPRFPVPGLSASFDANGSAVPVVIADLSRGGARMLVPADAPGLNVGDRVVLNLVLMGQPRFPVSAEVVRRASSGIGLRFIENSPEQLVRLDQVIAVGVASEAETVVRTSRGPVAVSTSLLRHGNVYEVLNVDPLVSLEEFASAAAALAAGLERDMSSPDEQRASLARECAGWLARLKPVWTDVEARLRYDFARGFIFAEERRKRAEDSTGPRLDVLRRIWRDAYPKTVEECDRLAHELVAQRLTPDQARDERERLDPFGERTAPVRPRPLEAAPVTNELIFDRFRLKRRIAVGGMGEVFLASDEASGGREVVLKSLLPDLIQQPSMVGEFLGEARLVAQLNHPHIVKIYQVGRSNGGYHIAMEYLPGVDLRHILDAASIGGKGIDPAIAARIVHDIALALDFAHKAKDSDGRDLKIVHRDVSPSNVMICDDGSVRLVDFGIAKSVLSSSRTTSGVVRGKVSYMSPEQLRGEPLDGRSDQYALGVVFWELLTAKRLFGGGDPLKAMERILTGGVPTLQSIAPELPSRLVGVVGRMLSVRREDRFPDLRAVALEIDIVAGGVEPLAKLVAAVREHRTLPDHQDDFVVELGEDDALPELKRGVVGSLEDVPFLEIVQTLDQGRRSAEVEVWQRGRLVGVFGFRDGQLAFGACGPSEGVEALREALRSAQTGDFRIRYVAPRVEFGDLQVSTAGVVLDVMRVFDEGTLAPPKPLGLVDPRYSVRGLGPPGADTRDAEERARAAERERSAAEQATVAALDERAAIETKLRRSRRLVDLAAAACGVALAAAAVAGVELKRGDERQAHAAFQQAVAAVESGDGPAALGLLAGMMGEAAERPAVARLRASALALEGKRKAAIEAYGDYLAATPDAADRARVAAMLQEAGAPPR